MRAAVDQARRQADNYLGIISADVFNHYFTNGYLATVLFNTFTVTQTLAEGIFSAKIDAVANLVVAYCITNTGHMIKVFTSKGQELKSIIVEKDRRLYPSFIRIVGKEIWIVDETHSTIYIFDHVRRLFIRHESFANPQWKLVDINHGGDKLFLDIYRRQIMVEKGKNGFYIVDYPTDAVDEHLEFAAINDNGDVVLYIAQRFYLAERLHFKTPSGGSADWQISENAIRYCREIERINIDEDCNVMVKQDQGTIVYTANGRRLGNFPHRGNAVVIREKIYTLQDENIVQLI